MNYAEIKASVVLKAALESLAHRMNEGVAQAALRAAERERLIEEEMGRGWFGRRSRKEAERIVLVRDDWGMSRRFRGFCEKEYITEIESLIELSKVAGAGNVLVSGHSVWLIKDFLLKDPK